MPLSTASASVASFFLGTHTTAITGTKILRKVLPTATVVGMAIIYGKSEFKSGFEENGMIDSKRVMSRVCW